MTEEEFFEKVPEWANHDISRWNHVTCLAYFCQKYEKVNGVRFKLVRGKKGPTNGKEAKDFSKLFNAFAPEDYKQLSAKDKKQIKQATCMKIKNYINWMFDYKFRSGQKSVNGTQLFTVYNLMNEFERMYSKHVSKSKTSGSFNELLAWCKEDVPDIFNLHQLEQVDDLNMLKNYVNSYSLSDDSTEGRVVNKAKELNLL